jgi:Uma2 family endonuclease
MRPALPGGLDEQGPAGYVRVLVVSWLILELGTWAVSSRALIAGSNGKFAASLSSGGRKPDLTVYLASTRRPRVHGLTDAPPDIAVDVITPTPHDTRKNRIETLHAYAALGVKWPWLVDPERRTFEVLELGAGGRYVHAVVAVGGRIDRIPGCEGLTIDLDALWRELDGLARDES